MHYQLSTCLKLLCTIDHHLGRNLRNHFSLITSNQKSFAHFILHCRLHRILLVLKCDIATPALGIRLKTTLTALFIIHYSSITLVFVKFIVITITILQFLSFCTVSPLVICCCSLLFTLRLCTPKKHTI